MIISMTKKLILRSPLKSILTIIFSISIIIFIGLYINNIKTLETSLRKLSQTIPVTGEVCDISGSKTTGLEIDERKGNQIISSQYVVQAKYTIQVVANNINNQNNISTTLMGCNSIDALPLLYDDNIDFMSRNDSSFLTDDKNNCIVEADFAKQNNIVLGQEITFSLSIYKYDSGVYLTDNIDNIKMNVIGIYDYNSATNTSIIVPVKSLARLVKESGNEVFYDSLKFELKDPGKLNEFKQDVKSIGFSNINSQSVQSVAGNSLIVYDNIYIENASNILDALQMYRLFEIPFIILMFVLYVLVIFLLIKNKQLEMAISLSLGQSKKAVNFNLFLEIEILSILGCLLGVLVLASITDIEIFSLLMIFFGFLILSILGIMLVIKLLMNFDIMQLLSKTD
ncbi:MAG TPA: ABC transporter permease [Candidatus Erysipelatoclostridium merdavium]|uniref:ABC transporter permease n=1 Tax=Candidatus Erysipelatoclostridium merdavium TaxID=2838566 RepID=A0A9D1XMP1_9FIRM|nr:ABC transporter permease [Candidatus Erysipelatoclostridium merdavium]